jgi:hypothetical protein
VRREAIKSQVGDQPSIDGIIKRREISNHSSATITPTITVLLSKKNVYNVYSLIK